MNKNAELHDKIIEKAGELFREQGYAATSIKQIAKAAGCTNAALYYYFEGGKEHILREVIHQSAAGGFDFITAVSTADTLAAMLIQLSQILNQTIPQMANQINWLLLQFSALPVEEQQFLQSQIFNFHDQLQTQLSRFIEDETTTDKLAWFIFCSYFGFQQIFSSMQIGQVVDMDLAQYGQFMANMVVTENG